MYQKQSGLIIGFHGCDSKVQKEAILSSKNILLVSNNAYDWLGHGIYFWENSPERALEFARESSKRNKKQIQKPAVLGATIDVGNCLDLLDSGNLNILRSSYLELKEIIEMAGGQLPENKSAKGSADMLLRHLDCYVIEHLLKKTNYDSVRGLFPEGEELYPGAGFRNKDHIQICVRNPNCIKGYFLPRIDDNNFPHV